MSNGYRWELLSGKGVTFLSYWDYRQGDDTLIEIRDGVAYATRIRGEEQPENTQVDLARFLEEWIKQERGER
jgi:hypothetical protein